MRYNDGISLNYFYTIIDIYVTLKEEACVYTRFYKQNEAKSIFKETKQLVNNFGA